MAFDAPFTTPDQCTDPVDLVVPLRGGGNKAGRLTVVSVAQTAAKGRAGSDPDKLRLTCLP